MTEKTNKQNGYRITEDKIKFLIKLKQKDFKNLSHDFE